MAVRRDKVTGAIKDATVAGETVVIVVIVVPVMTTGAVVSRVTKTTTAGIMVAADRDHIDPTTGKAGNGAPCHDTASETRPISTRHPSRPFTRQNGRKQTYRSSLRR